jgi:hypothetical protein
MLMNDTFEKIRFSELVDEIFSLKDRQKSQALIDHHSRFWMQMQSGSQGISGKKTINSMTMFNELFTTNEEPEEEIIDSDDAISLVLE